MLICVFIAIAWILEWENIYMCAWLYTYSDSALKQTIYMMHIGYANYLLLGVLVMCVWYTSVLITSSFF